MPSLTGFGPSPSRRHRSKVDFLQCKYSAARSAVSRHVITVSSYPHPCAQFSVSPPPTSRPGTATGPASCRCSTRCKVVVRHSNLASPTAPTRITVTTGSLVRTVLYAPAPSFCHPFAIRSWILPITSQKHCFRSTYTHPYRCVPHSITVPRFCTGTFAQCARMVVAQ